MSLIILLLLFSNYKSDLRIVFCVLKQLRKRQMQFIESLLSLQRNFVINNPAAENVRSDSILVARIERSARYNNSRFSVLFFVALSSTRFLNFRLVSALFEVLIAFVYLHFSSIQSFRSWSIV